MIFYPITSRRNAFTEGMLRFLLETKYESSRPMGNVAQSNLGTVIKAWLVGLGITVAPVVPRCIDWLGRAIDTDEKFGASQDLYRCQLHWAKGIADWMDTGWESGEWERARVFEEAAWRYEKRPWPMSEIIKYGLDDYMAFAFQARDDSSPDGLEAYENGIQMYEHWVSNKPPSMSHSRTAGSNSKGLRRYAELAETGLACVLSDWPQRHARHARPRRRQLISISSTVSFPC